MIPMPSETNSSGDVFGGWIMAQVDTAASIPAALRVRGRVATVAVNSFVFKEPVLVGDLLSLYADVIKVGTTSVTVAVEVYAQRMTDPERLIKVTEATVVYVAIGEDRKPRPVDPPQGQSGAR